MFEMFVLQITTTTAADYLYKYWIYVCEHLKYVDYVCRSGGGFNWTMSSFVFVETSGNQLKAGKSFGALQNVFVWVWIAMRLLPLILWRKVTRSEGKTCLNVSICLQHGLFFSCKSSALASAPINLVLRGSKGLGPVERRIHVIEGFCNLIFL